MSGLSDFFNMLRGRPTAAQQKALDLVMAPNGFVNEVMTTIVTGSSRGSRIPDTSTLESMMSLNELVYACIRVRAQSARDPRLLVERQTTKDGQVAYEEIKGHPFRQLFMRPNPMMTESDLMYAAIVSWDVSNPRRFFAEKEYTNGRLTALYPLNPAAMQPRYSSDRTEVLGYVYSDGRYRREYTIDDLLIRSAPAWYEPPPLGAALGSVNADTLQTAYISTFFEGGGIPAIFLKYNFALNDTRREEIRSKWREVYGSAEGSNQIGILDINSDVKEIGSRLDQLGSQTLRSVSESRICMVFGVPPLIVYAYVGLLRATYSNLKEAWAGFWDATMSPAFKEWRDWWQWNLLVEFEDEKDIRSERVRLNYDMSQVAALQDDVDAIQKRARESFRDRLISQNEGRAALGYAPVLGGDEVYYSPAGPAFGAKALPAKSRDSAEVRAVERRMENTVNRYLSRQYEIAADGVE